MKLNSIFLMLLFLCSCGQGGSGTNNETSTPGMEDMDVSPDFAFIGGETLTITVVDESPSIKRRYLNVCSNFADDNGTVRLSYDSCLLRTSLEGQLSEFEVVISSNQQELVAQIWSLQDDALPANHRWSRSENRQNWKITLY